MMKATQILHDLGQSLWLDNITRSLLKTGVLRRYITELSVTGLTSNPTIFDHAIKNSSDYDDAIKSKLAEGKSGEKLFFELALDDLRQAADLFRPVYDRTCGLDGWVSLEVSPLLAQDTKSTIEEDKSLHAQAQCRIGGVDLHQPLGRGGDRQGPGDAQQSARHRHRQADLQGLPGPAEFAAMDAGLQCWRASATPAVGQHRD